MCPIVWLCPWHRSTNPARDSAAPHPPTTLPYTQYDVLRARAVPRGAKFGCTAWALSNAERTVCTRAGGSRSDADSWRLRPGAKRARELLLRARLGVLHFLIASPSGHRVVTLFAHPVKFGCVLAVTFGYAAQLRAAAGGSAAWAGVAGPGSVHVDSALHAQWGIVGTSRWCRWRGRLVEDEL